MTLAQQIQLIDDLIAGNPDVTIKDYWKAIGKEKDRMITLLVYDSAMNKVVKVIKEKKKYVPKYLRTYRLHL